MLGLDTTNVDRIPSFTPKAVATTSDRIQLETQGLGSSMLCPLATLLPMLSSVALVQPSQPPLSESSTKQQREISSMTLMAMVLVLRSNLPPRKLGLPSTTRISW